VITKLQTRPRDNAKLFGHSGKRFLHGLSTGVKTQPELCERRPKIRPRADRTPARGLLHARFTPGLNARVRGASVRGNASALWAEDVGSMPAPRTTLRSLCELEISRSHNPRCKPKCQSANAPKREPEISVALSASMWISSRLDDSLGL
jgi:hypothetical protein